MIQNNNFSVLPFYDNIKWQHQNKPYAFGSIYPLYVDAKSIIPFQFGVLHIDDTLVSQLGRFIERATLIDALTGLRTDITAYIADSAYRNTVQDIDYIVYTASKSFAKKLAVGQYYIYIQFVDEQEVYSEVITVVDNIEDYLRVEWWDNADLDFDSGLVIYKAPSFKHILYLNTDIGKPEYKFEEEGKERDGYFFAEKQLSEKVYKFAFIAPEFLCDAFRFVRLSDNIHVFKNGIQYNVDSFLAEVAWQEQGDLASIDVEFKTNTVVKKIAAMWPQ